MNNNVEDSEIFSEFGKEIEKVLEKTLSSKIIQLNEKEKELIEREKIVQQILLNEHLPYQIQVRVGDRVFFTTKSILLSIKDSYFFGLLSSKFEKPKDNIYFIARDPAIFEYVLEYLIYGELVSDIEQSSILKKLIIDADFYLLPGLKKIAEEQLKRIKPTKFTLEAIFVKLDQGYHAGSGQYWQWNGCSKVNPDYFQLTTTSYNNDTMIIKKKGTYLVLIRTAFTNSANSMYMSLYANGSDVARCYNNFNTNYSASAQINEVFQFQDNTKLQVYQSYNSGPINSNPNNQFSIVLLP